MSDNQHPIVMSVKAFTSIEAIDAGNTVVVRFTAPDDREIALLVPRKAIAALQLLLPDYS